MRIRMLIFFFFLRYSFFLNPAGNGRERHAAEFFFFLSPPSFFCEIVMGVVPEDGVHSLSLLFWICENLFPSPPYLS